MVCIYLCFPPPPPAQDLFPNGTMRRVSFCSDPSRQVLHVWQGATLQTNRIPEYLPNSTINQPGLSTWPSPHHQGLRTSSPI